MVELQVPRGPEIGKLMVKQVSEQSRPPPVLAREEINDELFNVDSFWVYAAVSLLFWFSLVGHTM